MIKTKVVKLKMNSKTISHYIKLGYIVKNNNIYDIKVEDLTKGSKSKIIAICDECGNEKIVTYKEYNRNTSKYNIFCCSNKCATIKNKKTSLEKYGVEHYSKTIEYIEKSKNTSLNKFGFEFYTQSEEYKKIMKDKNVDYDDRINKQKITNLEKYGTDNYHQSQNYLDKKDEIIEKYKNTITKKLLNKYDNLISTDNKNYKFLCNHNHEFDISRELLKNRQKQNTTICTICNPVSSSKSGCEILLQDFINNNYTGELVINKRNIISPYELDIYIPDLKLAFEFNGLYWHDENHKNDMYHLNKTELCEKQGIQLIHIWEDDWIYKQNIVKSIILNNLGKIVNIICASVCEIKEIFDNELVSNFLTVNHIKGFIKSKIKIGLFYDDELVSLIIFNKSNNSYKLLRYCNKLNVNVIDGYNKILKYFIDNYNPSEITKYIDKSYEQVNSYEEFIFTFDKNITPKYYYIVGDIRSDKLNYSKNKLIKQGFDKNKTEHEIMLERKIYRIYDCGQLKYIYKKSEN